MRQIRALPLLATIVALAPASGTAQSNSLANVPTRVVTQAYRVDGANEMWTRLDPWWVTIAPSNAAVIFDGHNRNLRFFSAQGRPPSVIGRQGHGPGEFATGFLSMFWLADTLIVYDAGNRRFNFYTGGDRMLKEVVAPLISKAPAGTAAQNANSIGYRPLAMLKDHSLIVSTRLQVSGEGSNALFHISSTGVFDRQLGTWRISKPTLSIDVKNSEGLGGRMNFQIGDLDDLDPIAVSPDGRLSVIKSTVMARGDLTEVHLFAVRPDGRTQYDRKFQVTGVKRKVEDFRGMTKDPSLQRQLLAKAPPVFPPVELLVVGRDSTTWLQMRKTTAGTPFVMLDHNGSPQYQVVLPPKATYTLVAGSAGRLWVISVDAEMVYSVVGYSVGR